MYKYLYCLTNSGSLLTPDMTLPPVPTIPQCHALGPLSESNFYYCIYLHLQQCEIVGISTKQHLVAQNREFECTKVVLPQVQARGLYIISCLQYLLPS